MTNSVLPNTIREFSEDMLDQYDRMKSEGKTPKEILAFAVGFFNGLINGTIAILKPVEKKAVIHGFACIIHDMFSKSLEAGKSPEEILLSVRYYLIGTVDGIDFSAGNPVTGNRH
jgi:hypothetical protein